MLFKTRHKSKVGDIAIYILKGIMVQFSRFLLLCECERKREKDSVFHKRVE